MQTLESLQQQLRTVDELRSVVRTMKGLASSRIHRYEAATSSLDRYTQSVELGLQVLLHERPATVELPEPPEEAGRLAIIVLGSNQGMCGPFNRRIAQHALAYLDQRGVAPGDRLVATVGHRAANELAALGQPTSEEPALPTSLAGVTDAVRDLLVRIDRWGADGGVTRVVIAHNRPISRARYEPRVVTVVPFDHERLRRLRDRPWDGPSLPRRFGPWDAVFRHLVRQDLFVALSRAFANSLAAENGARLTAMQSAERNIDERADELEHRYHQRRQAAITAELLDVVSGWEALQGP